MSLERQATRKQTEAQKQRHQHARATALSARCAKGSENFVVSSEKYVDFIENEQRLQVVAPRDGVIYRQIVRGSAVSAGSEIGSHAPFLLVFGDGQEVITEVPEASYAAWQEGATVTVELVGQQPVQTSVVYRSPFCHPPRWRDAAWPGER